ncbi:hypothetical protein L7F22_032398 [Adiantum nelumboides]|nr:hypothetical protein [Adiantum nelumboides]
MELRGGCDYENGSTPSRLSPFPHNHVLTSTKFSNDDTLLLLEQAAADRPGVHIEVDSIATSIMQWTWGHKGLTGTCLAFLVQEELWTLKAWINQAESYPLEVYVFGMATYSRIMQFVGQHADKAEIYPLMVKLLEVEEIQCERETVIQLRDFIAQGVLDATEEESGDHTMCISSPLLRTAILRGSAIMQEEVDLPPDRRRLDRRWLVLQAIKTLDGNTLCRPECLNAHGEPSEYTNQFLFMCRVKAILRQAYPSLGARILPQAMQRSQLCLDTLVWDSNNFSKFGFELVANGSKKVITEHIERTVTYHELHSAQVFVINFCLASDQEILVAPCHLSIIFVSACFNVIRDLAIVTFVEMDGTVKKMEVSLQKWTGKISFGSCNVSRFQLL